MRLIELQAIVRRLTCESCRNTMVVFRGLIGCRYVFKNIRYAAPPVGKLRWAKPAAPAPNTTLQDGSYGPKCIQSSSGGMNMIGSGNTSPVGAAINQLYVPLLPDGLDATGSDSSAWAESRSPYLQAEVKTVSSWTFTSLEKPSRTRLSNYRLWYGFMAAGTSLGARTQCHLSSRSMTDQE